MHVDAYKLGVYQSLKVKDSSVDRFGAEYHASTDAPRLVGFMCGNEQKAGCLTKRQDTYADPHTSEKVKVAIHSCERGNFCDVVKNSRVVWIQPIIAHLPNGVDLIEVGVGGGGNDLEQMQNPGLECESLDLADVEEIFELYVAGRVSMFAVTKSATASKIRTIFRRRSGTGPSGSSSGLWNPVAMWPLGSTSRTLTK